MYLLDQNSDEQESISSENVSGENSSRGVAPVKREHYIGQENMIVVCTTESDRDIDCDRPVNFNDLDYRTDLKENLFDEREIQIISHAVEMEAHIICLSCVETAADIQEARRILKTARGHHM